MGLVIKAFEKLDSNKNGVLEVDDIRGEYDPSENPLVKEGKKTEEEVLSEFLSTFEMHHSAYVSLLYL